MKSRKKTQNVRELIKLLAYGVSGWAVVSFIGVMISGASIGVGDPATWVKSLLYSLVLSMFMVPALLVMYQLPKVENLELEGERNFEEDSEGLGVPEEISSSGRAPEEHEHRGRVWQDT